MFDWTTTMSLIFGQYDLIIDSADNFATAYVQRCRGAPRQAVCLGSIYRFDGQVSVFWLSMVSAIAALYPEPPAAGHGAELR